MAAEFPSFSLFCIGHFFIQSTKSVAVRIGKA